MRRSIHPAGREGGYILLTLLLVVSLMTIAAVAVAPNIAFRIKRDREEEFIHRGVQYSRGIRLYARKTGRFPIVLQELYDANGQKYIRKLYKDPITGGDFRLVHTADLMGGTAPVDLNKQQPQTGGDSLIAARPFSNSNPGATTESAANANSANLTAAADSGATDANNSSKTPLPADNPSQGLIFGVASTSKKKTIREFDHKNHYDQWLFFYDQNHDSGHEITGPTSLTPAINSLQNPSGVGQPANQPAAGQPGFSQSGFSQSGFNQSGNSTTPTSGSVAPANPAAN